MQYFLSFCLLSDVAVCVVVWRYQIMGEPSPQKQRYQRQQCRLVSMVDLEEVEQMDGSCQTAKIYVAALLGAGL